MFVSSLMYLDMQDASWQEIIWTIPAVVGFLASMILLRRIRRAMRALRYGVNQHPDKYRVGGPRWNFLTLMHWTIVAFGVGWLGYIVLGLIAMTTPPPVNPEVQEAADWVVWLLVCMEAAHAVAMTLLWIALRALSRRPENIALEEPEEAQLPD